MIKKMYCGLGILILLIIGTVVFVLVKQQSELADFRQDVVETNKLDDSQKPKQTPQVSKKDPKPPGASPNGHWHNGEWHDAPHTTPISANPSNIGKAQLPEAAEYHQKYKAYMKVYDEIQTEWWDIKKEMDVFNKMSEEEFHQKSETEKRQLAKEYVSLKRQWDKNREKLTAHKKTKPIRPDAAFK